MALRTAGAGASLALVILLGGCGMFGKSSDEDADTKTVQTVRDPYHNTLESDPRNFNPRTQTENDEASVMGLLFGGGKKDNGNGGGPGIGVNSFLWHAALDTVSFMPLASADPFGGTIISDWYSPAETPDERFKVNIFILSRELRADGLRASVFRQRRQPNGQWVDAAVDGTTATDIENAILTRARQIRVDTAQK